MLQFDIRVGVRSYDEVEQNRIGYVCDEDTAIKIREHLEFAIQKSPYIITEKDEVLVYSIEEISKV